MNMEHEINRPDQADPWHYLTSCISKNIKDRDVKFLHNVDSSLKTALLNFEINIFDIFEIMRISVVFLS